MASGTTTGVLGSRVAVAVATAIVTTVVVAGGMAVASVPNNSVNSRKIANNTIRSVDIRNNAVKGVDIRNGTVTRTDLRTAVRPRWAKVDADSDGATLIRGRGVSGVARVTTGHFTVTFASSITSCAWLATLNDNGSGSAANGEIAVEQNSSGDPTTLRVRTFDSAGTLEDPMNFDGFSVSVVC